MRIFLILLLLSAVNIAFGQQEKLEVPVKINGNPELIINHTGYTLSYNRKTNCPNWVAWELTAEEVDGTVERSTEFLPDPKLPSAYQVASSDYKNSGYDRGHMCPAGDMKWGIEAMKESFYMSNMCPQNHTLNGGAWERLESACRRWARQEGKVYIVCGPLYNKTTRTRSIGKDHTILVPDAFFKVVLSTRKGHEKAIGFFFLNTDSKQTMGEACTSVDEIERITGYDFFPILVDKLEDKVESKFKLSSWN